MRLLLAFAAVALSVYVASCAAPSQGASGRHGPFVASDLPALAGQTATCAGPRQKSFSLEAREVTLNLGMGVRFSAWTYAPLRVAAGDLVRAYVVNVGPGVSAIHVMGTILETVYDGASEIRDVQTYGIAPGSGAMVEFRIPEAGMYGLVDHDRLAYVPWGMVLTFDATDGEDAPTGNTARSIAGAAPAVRPRY
jgi:hypothetical protein